MRDFKRLREQLRVALLCGPLALAGCGGKSSPTTTTTTDDGTIGNETTDNTPVVRDVAWPVTQGYCDSGSWCGPVSQVAEAANSSVANGCPSDFSHNSIYFYADEAATMQHRNDGDAQSCCYYYNDNGGCGKGRPLLEDGESRVAPVQDGGPWSRGELSAAPADLSPELREELRQGWLDDALVEHASVASFARATLELMALGAPPELLADCARAGLDEVRHAEGCFALVERYGGRRVSPGPIAAPAARPADLARLAVDTFVEGCVAETVATLAATRALARCGDPVVARLLGRFVRDETRHAALAWKTVAWAVREGGPRVINALRAQAHAMAPRQVDDDASPEKSDGRPHADAVRAGPALLAHGRLDARTRRDAVVDAWREIIAPTLAEIVA